MKRLLFSIAFLFPFALHCQTINLVRDITPGTAGTRISEFRDCNGNLYFTVSASNSVELWKTKGDSLNTVKVKTIWGWSNKKEAFELTCFNNVLYFIAPDTVHGYELWRSDGTDTGTYVVKDINVGVNDAFAVWTQISTKFLQIFNNKLYFIANDGIHGNELWESDGTSAGTQMVIDLKTGWKHGAFEPLGSDGIRLYFGGVDNLDSFRLYVSNGSAAGTYPVMNTQPYSFSPGYMNFNGKVYYGGTLLTGNNVDIGLVSSNGTEAGTQLLIPTGNTPDFPIDFMEVNNRLFFNNYKNIYYTDGTLAGTGVLKDSLSFSSLKFHNDISAHVVVPHSGNLYFLASSIGNNNGKQLWKSDGTSLGTYPVYTFSNGADPYHLISVGGKIYTKVRDSLRVDIWGYDGVAMQKIVKSNTNFFTGSTLANSISGYSPFCVFNNQLYYTNAYDTAIGAELYKMDLTPSSLENIIINQATVVYPNPATDYLEIRESGIDLVRLYDISGKLLLEECKNKISVSGLAPGVYFISILKDNQKFFARFIKK